ncbi:MAG: hypothetical protein EXS37_02065 [Opitutus sp.]|nr:hypothetical protein [Opitutus sp.]
MKLILNIVRKDFLRLRWSLALLMLVMAIKYGLGWWLALGRTPDFETWKELPNVVACLVWIEVGLTWLISGMLVLEDSLAGTQANWRTRPIAGARLLAAKATGAFLLLCLPGVLFGLPWWLLHGLGWADMLRVSAVGLALPVLVIGPSYFVAALVDTMTRFVVWSLVGAASLLTFPLVWSMVLSSRVPTAGAAWAFFVVGTLGVVMTSVVVWRFRCGVVRSVHLGATVGLLGAVGAGSWWVLAKSTCRTNMW